MREYWQELQREALAAARTAESASLMSICIPASLSRMSENTPRGTVFSLASLFTCAVFSEIFADNPSAFFFAVPFLPSVV